MVQYCDASINSYSAFYRCHVKSLQCLGHLRRLDTSQGQLVRRQCLRKEVWRLFAMLGRHLVACLVGLDDLRHHRCAGCLPTGLGAAAEGQSGLHPYRSYVDEDLMALVCYRGSAVHWVRLLGKMPCTNVQYPTYIASPQILGYFLSQPLPYAKLSPRLLSSWQHLQVHRVYCIM